MSIESSTMDGSLALTADAMRTADRITIEEYGIPSFTLMEAAGRGTADAIEEAYGPVDECAVLVLCGKGNNGGDGLVVARRLQSVGARVHVLLTHPADELTDDPAHNYDLLSALQAEVSEDRLTISTFDGVDDLTERMRQLQPQLYVDALLGTGLTSDVREPIRSVVDWVNDQSAPTVAIDVPTGLQSDTGQVLGAAVEARHTITMGAPKVGMFVGAGPEHVGSIEVVDIGIPSFVFAQVADDSGCVRRTTDAAVRTWWPRRRRDAHKYSVGAAMVVGGSARFTGAPAMASRAAERNGAGYVTCACPDVIQSTLSATLTTVPTLPLPTDDDDGIDPDAADRVAGERADAVLVGPGLGRSSRTQQFVHRLLEIVDAPLVIDADGLNALAALDDDWFVHAQSNWILTPHVGEFRRLTGGVDLSDPVRTVQEHAQKWGVVLLLKGSPSIVAGPSGRTYLGATGTSALATAGTGDVLAGQCVGLLGQGVPALQAAATALHLGGAAAERYETENDGRSMMATDLIRLFPAVIHDVFHGANPH